MRIGNKLQECLDSIAGQYDELIIVDDKIDNLGKKINKGLKQATGDFIIVSNDDILLEMGSLRDLCIPHQVVSPKVIGGINKVFHAHMWCMPRVAYEQAVGPFPEYSDFEQPGYYEGFNRFYYDDSDYWMKLRTAGFDPVMKEDIVIRHDHPGWTLGTFGNNGEAERENREIFVERWGLEALKIIE